MQLSEASRPLRTGPFDLRAFRSALSLCTRTCVTVSRKCHTRFEPAMFPCSASAAIHASGGSDIIGIDLGTTNSCVAVMEGKVNSSSTSHGVLKRPCFVLTYHLQLLKVVLSVGKAQ